MNDFLNLRYIKTIGVEDNNDHYVVSVHGIVIPTICPYCGSEKLHKHGAVTQAYMDTPMHGKRVILTIERKRYRCTNSACNKTIFEPLNDMDPKRLATSRLIKYIQNICFKKTFADISREIGVDEKTIRHIFDDYAEHLRTTIKFETPRVLGIDEVKIIGSYKAMITNIEELSVYDLLESRKKSDLIDYFAKVPNLDQVKIVTMDMWRPYFDAIRHHLPNVPIVVDRFHVVRAANNAMEAIRKSIRKDLEPSKRIRLKDERFVLLSLKKNLNPEQLKMLEKWTTEYPVLHEAYLAKEGFLAIYEQTNKALAQKLYADWEKSLSPEIRRYFSDIISFMRNWWVEIFNYYDYRITNGYTESANNLVKEMNRMGRGYSFDVIKARILYDPIARKPTTKSIRGKGGKLNKPEPPPENSFAFINSVQSEKTDADVKVIEYGPHIPTLVKLLREGYFS